MLENAIIECSPWAPYVSLPNSNPLPYPTGSCNFNLRYYLNKEFQSLKICLKTTGLFWFIPDIQD
jgi:hypothetical protein